VGQLKALLKSVLDQWSSHKVASDEINSYLMEARYSLSRFRLLTGSSEAVQVQVDNLQVRNGFNASFILLNWRIWKN
jgi:nesprin-1